MKRCAVCDEPLERYPIDKWGIIEGYAHKDIRECIRNLRWRLDVLDRSND